MGIWLHSMYDVAYLIFSVRVHAKGWLCVHVPIVEELVQATHLKIALLNHDSGFDSR